MVQGVLGVLFEALGIFVGFDFCSPPPFDHPFVFKSGIPPPPPPLGASWHLVSSSSNLFGYGAIVD